MPPNLGTHDAHTCRHTHAHVQMLTCTDTLRFHRDAEDHRGM